MSFMDPHGGLEQKANTPLGYMPNGSRYYLLYIGEAQLRRWYVLLGSWLHGFSQRRDKDDELCAGETEKTLRRDKS